MQVQRCQMKGFSLWDVNFNSSFWACIFLQNYSHQPSRLVQGESWWPFHLSPSALRLWCTTTDESSLTSSICHDATGKWPTMLDWELWCSNGGDQWDDPYEEETFGKFGFLQYYMILYDYDFVWMSDPLRTLQEPVGPCQVSWLKPPRRLDPTHVGWCPESPSPHIFPSPFLLGIGYSYIEIKLMESIGVCDS